MARWPAPIEDCRAAVRWLRAHAQPYHLGDRGGAAGSSAGGHRVALLGTLDRPRGEAVSSRVQAVCDLYGPSDLLTMPVNVPAPGKRDGDLVRTNGARLLGGIVRDWPELAKQASPLYQVSAAGAPFLILHGDRDKTVPPDQSARLHARLPEPGVPSTLHVVTGAGHGGPDFGTPAVKALIRGFFDEHLKRRKD
jgi:acetyl esterase/lipase